MGLGRQIGYSAIFEIQSYAPLVSWNWYVDQIGLELMILLFLLPEPWDHRCVSPCLTKYKGFTAEDVSSLFSAAHTAGARSLIPCGFIRQTNSFSSKDPDHLGLSTHCVCLLLVSA